MKINNRRSILFVYLLAVVGISGCSKTTPEQAAREAGLLPEKIETLIENTDVNQITSPYLKELKQALVDAQNIKFPELAARPNFEAMFAANASSRYLGWDTDRIDASSYDALTDSLNAIMLRMGPDQARQFDVITKYVLMNITRDPMIAKKAVGGGQISDSEILQIIQSYLHDRTPKELTILAQRMEESKKGRVPTPGGQQQNSSFNSTNPFSQ